MMAPAGHVTVVIVPAPAPELHAVEYRPCEDVTDGLAGREADTERLADAETAAMLAPGDATEREAEADREDEREGEAERDEDGLADALTSLHCT